MGAVSWQSAAAEYLAARRARGYRLADEAVWLARFADLLDSEHVQRITVDHVIGFAQANPNVNRCGHARRFGVLRNFTVWLDATGTAPVDPVPPGLIRGGYQRVTPFIYTRDQVEQLLTTAGRLPQHWLAAAMTALIGLLYVSGLRSGEALAVDITDIDHATSVLKVCGKGDRHRLVPLHPTTLAQLDDYRDRRTAGPLFIGPAGNRLTKSTVHPVFRQLRDGCQIVPPPGGRPARLHDFRHTLAVDTLIDAHRHGDDVDARIALLCTFLGHREPINTYWYLTATPELMAVVSDRVAAALHDRILR